MTGQLDTDYLGAGPMAERMQAMLRDENSLAAQLQVAAPLCWPAVLTMCRMHAGCACLQRAKKCRRHGTPGTLLHCRTQQLQSDTVGLSVRQHPHRAAVLPLPRARIPL